MISSFWSNTVTTHTDTLNTNFCLFTKVGNSPQVDVNIHTHASMPAPGEANGFRNRPEIKAMIHCFKPWGRGIHQGIIQQHEMAIGMREERNILANNTGFFGSRISEFSDKLTLPFHRVALSVAPFPLTWAHLEGHVPMKSQPVWKAVPPQS